MSVCRSVNKKSSLRSKQRMPLTVRPPVHFSRRWQSPAAIFNSRLSFCASGLLNTILHKHFNDSTITGKFEESPKVFSPGSSFANFIRVFTFSLVITGAKTFLSLERIRRASKQTIWQEVLDPFSRTLNKTSHSFCRR